jgi:hypothetical protein
MYTGMDISVNPMRSKTPFFGFLAPENLKHIFSPKTALFNASCLTILGHILGGYYKIEI